MKSQSTVLHVINHTHWDREWFVPFTITRSWIPTLIRNLNKVVEQNPSYDFLFDGQTEVIEDLEQADKSAYHIATRLIKEHKLEVGPYYCQVEMRNPGPESLIRNLRIGTDTVRALGGSTDFTAWDVDSFGHVSQSPQIHALFGIHDVYLWRGPDLLAPFFWWKGPDGTTMLAIDLFAGGYRNFYRVTSKDELAMPRLQHEVRKLRPFYKSGHIPVFDGFDLDKEPGDAATYFARRHQPRLEHGNIEVVNSSPLKFAETIRAEGEKLPTLKGELISGKYSSVFPGTLSARVYSKLVATFAEQLLYRYAEPLSLLLPADKYPEKLFEEQNKLVLQNLVHDVISGCSIDQVHDTAELRAHDLDRTLREQVSQTLETASAGLANGTYAFLPSTGVTDLSVEVKGRLFRVHGDGVSVAKLGDGQELQKVDREVDHFSWKNTHYSLKLESDGVVHLGKGQFGQLVTRTDDGDTYWDEPRDKAVPMKIKGRIKIAREAEGYTELQFTAVSAQPAHGATVLASLTLDQSASIRWRLELETSGTGFSVGLRHDYRRPQSRLNVGMQFDNVVRDFQDTGLMERELSPELGSLLTSSQRDLYQTFTFPFQSYISPTQNPGHIHLLAKGLRAYQTDQPGIVDLILSRPVEWVMRPGLHQYHSGDAGPKYLVPGARSERKTVIECALLVTEAGPEEIAFHQTVDQFINPPLLFQVSDSKGTSQGVQLFNEAAPISSLHQYRGTRLARLYNPTTAQATLTSQRTELQGDRQASASFQELTPKRIVSVQAQVPIHPANSATHPAVKLLNWPKYPAGPDHSQASAESLGRLKKLYTKLQSERDSLESIIEAYGTNAPNALMHRLYVVTRECMEAELSLQWNDLRASGKKPDKDYAYPLSRELRELAGEYNDMRIVRRMYDYIVGVDVEGLEEARPAEHTSAKA
jgi:alpha-mannosidase